MTDDLSLASIAAAIGDQARSAMLISLMDGRSLTAKELAYVARISPSTASAHLGKLLDLGLIRVMRLGRNRYFRLASPLVGQMLETVSNVAAGTNSRYPRATADSALLQARTCYDHLAGQLGVMLADALQRENYVRLSDDGGEVTARGYEFLSGLGLKIDEAQKTRRIFCKPCLDWTERRPHLAGSLGAALCRHCFDHGWVERVRDTRALEITPEGASKFNQVFGIRIGMAHAHDLSAA
jgi:DNA-binding transcriptional ArsR family regulator